MTLEKTVIEEQFRWGAFSIGEGKYAHFAKAKDVFAHINQLTGPEIQSKPPVLGSNDDFLAKHNNSEDLQKQMKNKGKKCPNCGKIVAFTLPNCNQCGHSLKDVSISFSNNVFTAFIYGIEKGPFPFTISIRFQSPEAIVFDDLLSLASCHLNIIPTTEYIPDWRFLLKNPKKGQEILTFLFEHCWKVVKESFLSNEAWRKQNFKDGAANLSEEQLRSHVIAGFNYPPSQYQLHMQFMLPPLTPFHYFQYLIGTHYTEGRFFPIEYAKKVLALNESLPITDDTSVETIIEHFKSKGVDYHQIHAQCYARYGESHRLLSNYKREDFEAIATAEKVYQYTSDFTLFEETDLDPKQIQAQDKLILQNYGRPYVENKPSGSYYKFAKQFPHDVTIW